MDIEPIYPKTMTCTLCRHTFQTSRVRSRFVRVTGYDSDFKPNYKQLEANPIYYNVAVCPSCGYSFTDDFIPTFAPHTRQRLEQILSTNWTPRDFGGKRSASDAIETYKLAILTARLKEEKALPIAGLALRLAWIYRELNDEANEQRFLRVARDYYMTAYSEGDHEGTLMSEVRVIYMIAELSWRIGAREEAIRNFSRVIEAQNSTTDQKVVDFAKERWQAIREEK